MGLFSRKKTIEIKSPAKPVKTPVKKEKAAKQVEPTKQTMKELYSAPEIAVVKSGKKEGKKIVKYRQAYKIVIKPLVTEKVSNLGAQNKYVFQVAARANKIDITKAINGIYGVKPIKVNIINLSGKKAGYGRITGRRKDWKKAIVTLPAGQTIKVYEGV